MSEKSTENLYEDKVPVTDNWGPVQFGLVIYNPISWQTTG